jgi:hypothetical protein
MRLTDLAIRTLKAPEKGAVIYPDDVLTGFGVRVSEGGTKSFVLTHGVRRQRETIGRVGILGLQDARSEAKRRLRYCSCATFLSGRFRIGRGEKRASMQRAVFKTGLFTTSAGLSLPVLRLWG